MQTLLTGFCVEDGKMERIPEDEVERLKKEISVQRLAEARGIKLKRLGPACMASARSTTTGRHRSSSLRRRTSGTA